MSRRARLALAATLIAAAVALMPLLAAGHHGDVIDGNDTRGRLDVRKVHTFGTERPGWRIVTFKAWDAPRIWDRGYFLVYLDTFGDSDYDYFAMVSSYGPRLQGRLWRDRRDDREIGEVRTWRTDDRSVSVRIPLEDLRFPGSRLHIRWYVQTIWTGHPCGRPCFDVVPARSGVIEPVRPTPSPTDTLPTPLPTGNR